MKINSPSRGNAIFLVLIAIVLFSALVYALSKDWRANFAISGREQDRLYADEIIQYGNSFRSIIDQMILMNGAADNNAAGNGILFSCGVCSAAYGVYGTHPTTELFNPAGGKVTYQTPPAGACLSSCSYEFSGQYTVTGVETDTKAELAMLVINVSGDVCQKMNDLLDTGWSTVPTGAALTLTQFNGTNYSDMGGANPITLTGAFANLRAFCYRESSGAQRYIYVHVIRAR